MRIGIVDLDTSHPAAWIPIERKMGHTIAGVWDGGDVHPVGYAERFAGEQGIPRVYGTLAEMVPEVDGVILHGCDWDTHVEKARPFVEAGRAVLLDKPLAGNPRDLRQIRAWMRQGARIAGGSSLRFCHEAQEWLAQPVEERGEPHTVVCGCGVDDFNYGIHAYAMLAGLMGGGAASVRHLGAGVQRRVQVRWPDGRMGIVVVGAAAGWLPFHATILTEKGVHHFTADPSRLYRALLEAVLPYLAGQADMPPLSPDDLTAPERWAIAARRSWQEGDRDVALEEMEEDGGGYDGRAFAETYRRARYPEQ